MCEATCVINELRRIKDDLAELGNGPLNRLAVEALQHRIDGLIRQLKYFREGQSWCDPGSLLIDTGATQPPC